MNALALYGRYAAASVRAQFSYAGMLAMMSFGQFLATIIEFLGVWALFQRFGHIAGWSLGEVALFYGLVSVTFAIGDTITRGFDVFGSVFVKHRRVRPAAAAPAQPRRCSCWATSCG